MSDSVLLTFFGTYLRLILLPLLGIDHISQCTWFKLQSSVPLIHIICNSRFQTLWTMDLGSGKVDGVFEGLICIS